MALPPQPTTLASTPSAVGSVGSAMSTRNRAFKERTRGTNRRGPRAHCRTTSRVIPAVTLATLAHPPSTFHDERADRRFEASDSDEGEDLDKELKDELAVDDDLVDIIVAGESYDLPEDNETSDGTGPGTDFSAVVELAIPANLGAPDGTKDNDYFERDILQVLMIPKGTKPGVQPMLETSTRPAPPTWVFPETPFLESTSFTPSGTVTQPTLASSAVTAGATSLWTAINRQGQTQSVHSAVHSARPAPAVSRAPSAQSDRMEIDLDDLPVTRKPSISGRARGATQEVGDAIREVDLLHSLTPQLAQPRPRTLDAHSSPKPQRVDAAIDNDRLDTATDDENTWRYIQGLQQEKRNLLVRYNAITTEVEDALMADLVATKEDRRHLAAQATHKEGNLDLLMERICALETQRMEDKREIAQLRHEAVKRDELVAGLHARLETHVSTSNSTLDLLMENIHSDVTGLSERPTRQNEKVQFDVGGFRDDLRTLQKKFDSDRAAVIQGLKTDIRKQIKVNKERRRQKLVLQPNPELQERTQDLQSRNEEATILEQLNDHDLDLPWIHQKLTTVWNESDRLLARIRESRGQ